MRTRLTWRIDAADPERVLEFFASQHEGGAWVSLPSPLDRCAKRGWCRHRHPYGAAFYCASESECAHKRVGAWPGPPCHYRRPVVAVDYAHDFRTRSVLRCWRRMLLSALEEGGLVAATAHAMREPNDPARWAAVDALTTHLHRLDTNERRIHAQRQLAAYVAAGADATKRREREEARCATCDRSAT